MPGRSTGLSNKPNRRWCTGRAVGVWTLPLWVAPRSLLGRCILGAALLRMGLASPLVVIAVQVVTKLAKGFSYARDGPDE